MCYGFDTMHISMKLTVVCAQQMVIEIHSCVLHVVTDNRGTLPSELSGLMIEFFSMLRCLVNVIN